LVQLSETDYFFLLIQHHIISDDWSLHILFQELGELYQAFSRGLTPDPPNFPIQYTDFAHWQRKWLQGAALEEHLAYWKQHLDQAPQVLELPLDRPRPPAQTFRGAVQTFALSSELSQSLQMLSRKEDVTLFMTLLAAFNVLLYRYTGQNDILIGSPVANRRHAE